MGSVVLKNGEVIDRNGRRSADVVVNVDNGKIVEVGENLSADLDLDAQGCVISTGFVDLHTSLRQPGHEAAETIETGSRAAALGGYTAVVSMPDTTPCTDSAAVVNEVLNWGKSALCEIKPSAAISIGRKGHELSPMAELVDLGVRMFTDAGAGVQNDGLMRRALEYASGIPTPDDKPVVLAQHCEVSALSEGGVMHEGQWSSKLGLAGQPSESEELMVLRDIMLSRLVNARVHFQHLSTAGSVEMVRQAKADGLLVTAEVTTHHFLFTDAACANYGTEFKVQPPLRTAADVAAIKEGLADGTIDVIATDHAPHTPDSKERPFDSAPPGMLGVETAFAIANTELDLPYEKLFDLMSWTPAKIAGLDPIHGGEIGPGAAANLAVIDPNFEWVIKGKELASKANNTPYENKVVTGKIRHTLYRGETVVQDGKATR